jgi:hypothetical protein
VLQTTVRSLLQAMGLRIGAARSSIGLDRPIDVDDSFVGGGYGIPTADSTEALELVARTEGIVLDPVYTAKAMAALISGVRARKFPGERPSCSGTLEECPGCLPERAAGLRTFGTSRGPVSVYGSGAPLAMSTRTTVRSPVGRAMHAFAPASH